MTKNVENRSRVQAGIKTGGQFAPESHSEPAGVTLTRPATSRLDEAAVAALGDVVRTNANIELGTWQRSMDKGRRGYEHEPREPMPPQLADALRQAAEFESLPVEEQRALLDALQLSAMKHILEPGQRLGTDTVQVAEGLNIDEANLALTLASQKQVSDARLPGTITLTGIGDSTKFSLQDGGIKHRFRVGSAFVTLRAEPKDDEDYARGEWLSRAEVSSFGRSILQDDRSADIASQYKDHRAYAVLMNAMADSPFKDHPGHFVEMDRETRTVGLRADGVEVTLDVSGDVPVLRSEGHAVLHPSMTAGFLDYMAQQTGRADGEAFASDLREVFRETDQRLIP
jgi:hypothetical protein